MGPFSHPNRFAMVLEILIPFLIAIWGHMQLNKKLCWIQIYICKGINGIDRNGYDFRNAINTIQRWNWRINFWNCYQL